MTNEENIEEINEQLTGAVCPKCGYPIILECGIEVCYRCGWSNEVREDE